MSVVDLDPDEFIQLVKDGHALEAVAILKEQIMALDNEDQQIAARACFLLVSVSEVVRLCLNFDEDHHEDLMKRLARLSILIDERLREILDDWMEVSGR